MISLETLNRLRRFDTPTICNLIELFEVRPRTQGYMDARIRASFPELGPIVGYAATATFRALAPPRKGDAYSSLDRQVEKFAELSGPPLVVFQDLDDPSVAATFGEVMCTVYQSFGAVGLISSGTGRDLDQVRRLGFPVFTNGTVCAHGYLHIPSLHVPVHVGGIAVFPDDLLHADCNGVTTIPIEIADELVDIGEEFMAAEAIVIEAMRGTQGDFKLLRERRAESKAMIEKLRVRVSRVGKANCAQQ